MCSFLVNNVLIASYIDGEKTKQRNLEGRGFCRISNVNFIKMLISQKPKKKKKSETSRELGKIKRHENEMSCVDHEEQNIVGGIFETIDNI